MTSIARIRRRSLSRWHQRGKHKARRVEGCPLCNPPWADEPSL